MDDLARDMDWAIRDQNPASTPNCGHKTYFWAENGSKVLSPTTKREFFVGNSHQPVRYLSQHAFFAPAQT